MVITLAMPAFAECACCEDMLRPEARSAAEESSNSCHAPEPVADAPMQCHEEDSPKAPRHPAADVVAGCQFECSDAVAMTGLATENALYSHSHVKVSAPVMECGFVDTRIAGTYGAFSIYESPPEFIALNTQHYRSIRPPRI